MPIRSELDGKLEQKIDKGYSLVEFFNEDSIMCLVKCVPYKDFSKCFVRIIKVDTDRFPNLKKKYNIKYLPTLILFKDGKEIGRIEGFTTNVNKLKGIFARAR